MLISELGEFGLINRFSKNFLESIPKNIKGIGDDCAVVPYTNSQSLVITTDLLIENSHFLFDKISAYELGYKSVAVNFSDIASMGAKPLYAFLSIGLTKDLTVEWVDDFFLGISDICKKYNAFLLGGDTTKSQKDIVVNLTVIGIVENSNIKYRSGAKVGDYICVNNNLGNSAAGLHLLLNENLQIDEKIKKILLDSHHLPEPNVEEGVFLSQFNSVTAMMDVSDGVDSDIRHIMRQSEKGAKLFVNKIPTSNELKLFANTNKLNALDFALAGGEDYFLLFTIDKNNYDEINKEYKIKFGNEITIIGEITNSNELEYFNENEKIEFNKIGFDHFKKGNAND